MNRYKCYRCDMGFCVLDKFKRSDNISRCAEGCGLAMADRKKDGLYEMVTTADEVDLITAWRGAGNGRR